MASDRLYTIALKYKKSKLWKQMYDTELFALRLTDGRIAYCCVMGMLGEHIALGVYVGCEGLDSYRLMGEVEEAHTEMERVEMSLSQDCLQCAFENKVELRGPEVEEAQRYAKSHGVSYRGRKAFPQFVRYRPQSYPWYIRDADDEQVLYEALKAALAVADRLVTADKEELGFTEGAPYDREIPLLEKKNKTYYWSMHQLPAMRERHYPSPVIGDDILMAKLQRKKKRGSAVWICEVIVFPSPISDEATEGEVIDEPENAPYFPYMLLIVDSTSGMMIANALAQNYEEGAEKLLSSLAHAMLEHGVPSEILVRNERTGCLLRNFAGKLNMHVRQSDDLSLLDEIEEDMIAHLTNNDEEEEDGGAADMLNMLMELDDATFQTMPIELKTRIVELEKQGVLPDQLARRVRRLL